jgi:hypothetical protein
MCSLASDCPVFLYSTEREHLSILYLFIFCIIFFYIYLYFVLYLFIFIYILYYIFLYLYIYCRTVQSSYILQKGEHLQSAPACGTHSIGRVRKMCSLTTDCVVILHPIFYRKRTLAVSTCLRNTFYSERTHSIVREHLRLNILQLHPLRTHELFHLLPAQILSGVALTCVCVCLYVCIHRYIPAYMHVCIHTYIPAYMYVCIHTYIYTCIHAYTCTHAHTHTSINIIDPSINVIHPSIDVPGHSPYIHKCTTSIYRCTTSIYRCNTSIYRCTWSFPPGR